MLKNNLLLGSILGFIVFAPFANAAYFDATAIVKCSKRVRMNSSFACLTQDEVAKFSNYHQATSQKNPPTSNPFTIWVKNTGKYAFRLHAHGDAIKPGQTSAPITVNYVYPCYWTRGPFSNMRGDKVCSNYKVDDAITRKRGHGAHNEVKIHRSDSLASSRTLSADVQVSYQEER